MKKVLKISLVVVATLIAVVFTYAVINFVIASKDANTTQQSVVSATTPTPPTAAELLSLVNAERAKVGVAPLIEDARLDQSAQRKADDMVKYNYFNHVSPHDGEHGYQYINDVGIYCRTDGENIFWGRQTDTAQSAMDWWMNSAPHKAAILNAASVYTGFGIAGDKVVEHFCQP